MMSVFDEFDRVMRRMRRELERTFSEAYGFPKRLTSMIWPEAPEGYRWAPGDVREERDRIKILVELAGVPKENVTLNATEDTVDIRGSFPEEVEKLLGFKGYVFHSKMPSKIDPKGASAKFLNGLLSVDLPKRTPERVGVRIEVE
jgi:HSP20 family molecular chaperone IbpA